jgi:hypothetical protein
MLGTNPALIAVELVAASIWIGGMVCIAIVFQVARNVLDESSQVALFRPGWDSHGRRLRGRGPPSSRSHSPELSS